MSEQKIKPCPWCGGDNACVHKHLGLTGVAYVSQVICPNGQCAAVGPHSWAEAEAISAWNRIAQAVEQQACTRSHPHEEMSIMCELRTKLARCENEAARYREAAKHLDEMLLRLSFDAGAIGDEKVSRLGIDPWGTLRDFRATFGLPPTMTPEQYTCEALKESGTVDVHQASIERFVMNAAADMLNQMTDIVAPDDVVSIVFHPHSEQESLCTMFQEHCIKTLGADHSEVSGDTMGVPKRAYLRFLAETLWELANTPDI